MEPSEEKLRKQAKKLLRKQRGYDVKEPIVVEEETEEEESE